LIKEKISYFGTNSCRIHNERSSTRFIPFLVVALLASVVVLPIPSALAGSNEDDFDHDDDIGDFDRTVDTRSPIDADAAIFQPLHPERRTITGDNDGGEIDGTRHDDIIIGTTGNDRMFGRNGADVMNGAGGADTKEGNRGDDTMQGAEGDDQMYGEAGNDVVSGGNNNDYISAGSGMDQLFGGDNDDTLKGGSGADYFDCGPGFDVITDFDSSKGDVHNNIECEVILEVK
jgi:Ca2+-binding RTX toxin-like protein